MKITVEQFSEAFDENDGYSPRSIAEFFSGRDSMSAAEICELGIPIDVKCSLFSRLIGPLDTSREVARRIISDHLRRGPRKISEQYQQWIDTGDECSRKAALDIIRSTRWRFTELAAVADDDSRWVAAKTAWCATWNAGQCSAEYDNDRLALYIGWMAEWLDKRGNDADSMW